MDKIGDYFYLIIIGVVVLTRIISGLSKAKQNKTIPDNETETPPPIASNWEEVLRELRGEENIPTQAEPVLQLPKKKKKEKPVTIEPLNTTTTPTIKNNPEKEPVVENTEEWNNLLTDADDAKKAFVLSEIFHRKY